MCVGVMGGDWGANSVVDWSKEHFFSERKKGMWSCHLSFVWTKSLTYISALKAERSLFLVYIDNIYGLHWIESTDKRQIWK